MNEQWLSIVEYARQHNISDMTVRRRIKSGRLPAVLKEGKYFIQRKESQFAATRGEQSEAPERRVEAVAGYSSPVSSVRPPLEAPQRSSSTPQKAPHQTTLSPAESMATNASVREHGGTGSPRWMTPYSRDPSGAEGLYSAAPAPRNLPPLPSPSANPSSSPGAMGSGTYQGIVPQDIAQPLMQKGSVTVDARALLQYCDQTLKRLHGREKRTEELYQQRLRTAEAHLDAKNLEIRLLKEQIEDLELLVKILEKKPGVAA